MERRRRNDCLLCVYSLTTDGALCHGCCLSLRSSHCVTVQLSLLLIFKFLTRGKHVNTFLPWIHPHLNHDLSDTCILPALFYLWICIEDWYNQPGTWMIMWCESPYWPCKYISGLMLMKLTTQYSPLIWKRIRGIIWSFGPELNLRKTDWHSLLLADLDWFTAVSRKLTDIRCFCRPWLIHCC